MKRSSKAPFAIVLLLSPSQVFSYLLIYLYRRQAAILLFLDHQPSARSQLMALGKLAVVDNPPSPAVTPISIDQTLQAPSPSIPKERLQDRREIAIPSNSVPTDGYEHDSLQTDEPHTHISSSEGASPDSSVPGTPNSTDTNKGSVTNPSLVEEGGLEHDCRPYETVIKEKAVIAEAGDGAVQHPANIALNIAQGAHAQEPPQTREDVLSPPSPTADS